MSKRSIHKVTLEMDLSQCTQIFYSIKPFDPQHLSELLLRSSIESENQLDYILKYLNNYILFNRSKMKHYVRFDHSLKWRQTSKYSINDYLLKFTYQTTPVFHLWLKWEHSCDVSHFVFRPTFVDWKKHDVMNTFLGYRFQPLCISEEPMKQWFTYVEQLFIHSAKFIDFIKNLIQNPSFHSSDSIRVLTLPQINQKTIDYLFSNLFLIFGDDQCIHNNNKIIVFPHDPEFERIIQFNSNTNITNTLELSFKSPLPPSDKPPSPSSFLFHFLK